MEISLAGLQDLTLSRITGDEASWDLVSPTGLIVSLVKSEELQRIVQSTNNRSNNTGDMFRG